MKLGGGVLGRTFFFGTLVSVLCASALSACGDDTTSGGNAGEDGVGGESPGSGGGGTGEDPIASCDDRSTSGTKVSGAITSDTTWSGRVYLESSVTVSGATLTIEPGTVVVAAADSQLTVSAGGAIVAGGTEAKPIAFCGASGEAGLWSGIAIADDAAATSELSYTLVSNAGAGDAALVLDATALVDNIAVTDSGADGVHASTFAEGSEALTVAGAAGAPVVLTHAAAVSPFPVGGDLTGNGDDHVVLRFESAEADMTFAKLSVPYLQEADLDVVAGDLEYLAGVVYHLAEQVMLDVGVGTETLRFDVNGTEEQPVKFEGPSQETVYSRVRIGDHVLSGSLIQHAQFRYGGELQVLAPVVLQHVLVERNQVGLFLGNQGLGTGSIGLVLNANHPTVGLQVTPGALLSIPADTQIAPAPEVSASFVEISICAGTFSGSGTLVDLGIPYAFLDYECVDYQMVPFEIAAGASLLVPAGSRLGISQGHSLVVHGDLQLLGTASDPVILSQTLFATYSNLDVAADAHPNTKFEYVQFSGGDTCLTLHKPVPITNSSFDGCTTEALRAYTTSTNTETVYEGLFSNLTFGATTPNGVDEPVFVAL